MKVGKIVGSGPPGPPGCAAAPPRAKPDAMTADMLVIPYGCARVPASLATVPCATVARARRRPLRLNDGLYDFAEPPSPARLADSAAQLGFLRDHLAGLCDPWAAHQRRFIEHYFAFVAWRVASLANALGTRLARFGGLYRVEDFGFSALRPLPRAHLRHEDGTGWVAADFAFWSGDGVIALDIADTRRTRRRRDADHAALRDAGVTVVALAPDALTDSPADLAARLPAGLVDFCADEALPASPFKAAALGDIVDGVLRF